MSKQTNENEEKCPPFVLRVVEEQADGVTIEVTKEDYERDLSFGIPPDELLNPGKHHFRRVPAETVAKFRNSKPHQANIETKIRLDLDVLKYFRERAESLNIDLFQDLINSELRRVMENDANVNTTRENKRKLREAA